MAETEIGTSHALTKKLWEEKLHKETLDEAYFAKMTSTDGNKIVHEKTQLSKGPGDEITIGLRKELTGTGVTGEDILEGQEEDLEFASMKILLDQYRHAVKDKGELSRKRAVFSMDDEAKAAIKQWGVDKLDQLHFDALFPTSASKNFYKTGSSTITITSTPTYTTAKSALVAAESKLTLQMISFVKTNAMTGGNKSYNALRPIKIGSEEFLVLLTHPDALYDLKQTSEFQQAQREAEVRGKENPLFTGATAVWDGVIVHTHRKVPVGVNAGASANVAYSEGALLGAQALCIAHGMRGELVERDFDYGNKHGFAWKMILGVKKSVFESKDWGSVRLLLSRTNVSGA